MRVAILGWLGKGNYGDDLMALQIVKEINSQYKNTEITFFADHKSLPKCLLELGSGISIFNHIEKFPFIGAYLLLGLLYYNVSRYGKIDIFILGGGSILKNSKTIMFYIKLMSMLKNHNPNCLFLGYSLSIGPFDGRSSKDYCRNLLPFFNALDVRDSASIKFIRNSGLSKHNISITQSKDYGFKYVIEFLNGLPGKERHKLSTNKIIIGISLRAGTFVDSQYRLVKWLSLLPKGSFLIRFIAMSNNKKFDDLLFAKRMAKKVGILQNSEFFEYNNQPDVTIDSVRQCDYFLAIRLHAAITSVACGIFTYYMPYEKKVSDFAIQNDGRYIRKIDNDMLNNNPLCHFLDEKC